MQKVPERTRSKLNTCKRNDNTSRERNTAHKERGTKEQSLSQLEHQQGFLNTFNWFLNDS